MMNDEFFLKFIIYHSSLIIHVAVLKQKCCFKLRRNVENKSPPQVIKEGVFGIPFAVCFT
jgi:hypothetical protein